MCKFTYEKPQTYLQQPVSGRPYGDSISDLMNAHYAHIPSYSGYSLR
jgi:hypothetical protein